MSPRIDPSNRKVVSKRGISSRAEMKCDGLEMGNGKGEDWDL